MVGGPQENSWEPRRIRKLPRRRCRSVGPRGKRCSQHGFQIQRGAYCLADFAERFELSHRSRQFAGSLLQFLKQPHVLDGDHGLVCEGLEQLLSVCP